MFFSFDGFVGFKIFKNRLNGSEFSSFLLEMLKNEKIDSSLQQIFIFWDKA